MSCQHTAPSNRTTPQGTSNFMKCPAIGGPSITLKYSGAEKIKKPFRPSNLPVHSESGPMPVRELYLYDINIEYSNCSTAGIDLRIR